MIHLADIPVDIVPERLALEAGVSGGAAAVFLEDVRPLLDPAGVFDEVDAAEALNRLTDAACFDWGSKIIIGACSIGPGPTRIDIETDSRSALWTGFRKLAFQDALDYLEYRIRQFLKPLSLSPGARFFPGCPELPLKANQVILDHLGPGHRLGLKVLPSGELDNCFGLTFLYTTSLKPIQPIGCAACSRLDCPARIREKT